MFWVWLEILVIFISCFIDVLIFVLSLIPQWRLVSSVLLVDDNFNQLIIKLLAFLFLSCNRRLGTVILFGSTTFNIFSFGKSIFYFVRVLKSCMFIWMIFVLFERFSTILLCRLLTAGFWTVFNDSRRPGTERVSRLIIFSLIIGTDFIRFCPDTGL